MNNMTCNMMSYLHSVSIRRLFCLTSLLFFIYIFYNLEKISCSQKYQFVYLCDSCWNACSTWRNQAIIWNRRSSNKFIKNKLQYFILRRHSIANVDQVVGEQIFGLLINSNVWFKYRTNHWIIFYVLLDG